MVLCYIIFYCIQYMFVNCFVFFFFFKQKTAYEMRISDWSSDVCSSDLAAPCYISRQDQRGRSPRRRPIKKKRTTPMAKAATPATKKVAAPRPKAPAKEIGRASCRERVCQYV